MFDISWGEFIVVVGLGLALVGKKDLPKASNFVGTQVGRVVGLLQGARVRADRYAQQNELRQLQNELRSGLRELDAVRTELAVSVSGGSRGVGAMVSGVNKRKVLTSVAGTSTLIAPGQGFSKIEQAESTMATTLVGSSDGSTPSGSGGAPAAYGDAATATTSSTTTADSDHRPSIRLPPVEQTIGAVVEDEWKRRGIDFKSQAEMGAGLGHAYDQSNAGSVLLSNLIRSSLIFDQYDRTVAEQDEALQSRIDKIQQQKTTGGKSTKTS